MIDTCAGMDLVTRGRLSVQRVEAKAWDAISLLAENGGWDCINLKPGKNFTKADSTTKTTKSSRVSKKRKTHVEEDFSDHGEGKLIEEVTNETARTVSHKRRVPAGNGSMHNDTTRRSRRRKISS